MPELRRKFVAEFGKAVRISCFAKHTILDRRDDIRAVLIGAPGISTIDASVVWGSLAKPSGVGVRGHCFRAGDLFADRYDALAVVRDPHGASAFVFQDDAHGELLGFALRGGLRNR